VIFITALKMVDSDSTELRQTLRLGKPRPIKLWAEAPVHPGQGWGTCGLVGH
jgi:hypothetical protein